MDTTRKANISKHAHLMKQDLLFPTSPITLAGVILVLTISLAGVVLAPAIQHLSCYLQGVCTRDPRQIHLTIAELYHNLITNQKLLIQAFSIN